MGTRAAGPWKEALFMDREGSASAYVIVTGMGTIERNRAVATTQKAMVQS